jgi:ATP synthase F1 complex assembly factor 2
MECIRAPAAPDAKVPSKSLALAIAAEWEWQSGRSIRPFTMPLMALVSTAVNQMVLGELRDLHIRKLLEYFSSDVTLCRAEPGPLAERQKQIHGPILEWARSELGPVTPSESIFGAEQPFEVVRAAKKRLESLDAFELTAVFNSAASSKSLLTGRVVTPLPACIRFITWDHTGCHQLHRVLTAK